MKKKILTSKVLSAHQVLSTAKYGKLDDADKIKVWKIARKLAPVAEKFDADVKDASEKLKPTEDFNDRLQKAQEYEAMIRKPDYDAQKLPMGAAEYDAFIKELQKYNKLVGDAVKEFGDKEVSVEFEPVSEDAFGKLMASNDSWKMAQVVELGELIVE